MSELFQQPNQPFLCVQCAQQIRGHIMFLRWSGQKITIHEFCTQQNITCTNDQQCRQRKNHFQYFNNLVSCIIGND